MLLLLKPCKEQAISLPKGKRFKTRKKPVSTTHQVSCGVLAHASALQVEIITWSDQERAKTAEELSDTKGNKMWTKKLFWKMQLAVCHTWQIAAEQPVRDNI